MIVETDPIPPDSSWTLEITGVTDEEASNVIVPNPTDCVFTQISGRFCTDFSAGLPAGTIAFGTTPPAVGPEGALHLTDKVNSQQNYWAIPLPSTETFQSFKATWKTRLDGIGGADGMSFNAGMNLGTSGAPFTPEEGAGNGLSVTVDTFDNGGGEVGIEVRWNGARLSFTQIGGGNVNGPPELENGTFVDDVVDVSSTGFVKFTHGTYSTAAQIPNYAGIKANMYVFAGRTGGANESAWIDDQCINAKPRGSVLRISRDNNGNVTISWDLPARLQCSPLPGAGA